MYRDRNWNFKERQQSKLEKNPTGGTIPNLKSNTLVYYLSPLPPGGF